MNAWYQLIGLLPFEWAHYVFMKNALLAILLISPLFALLGCMVIHNQMAFFSEALGHAALTGIAIGVLLGVADPLWSMTAFAILLALAVSALRRYSAASTDTIIGLVMSFTVALGVVLLSRGGGFAHGGAPHGAPHGASHGGSGKRIAVHLRQADGGYEIAIRDFGPGIPEAELPYVKQKFYKGSSKARGSGIGLAVCDEIVHRHGGMLTIENAQGGGTVVTIWLPLKG